jgi:polyhydroxybutyrate depolymerase
MNSAVTIALVLLVLGLAGLIGYAWPDHARAQPAAAPQAAYAPGDYRESIVTADGRTRRYVLHMPSGFSPAKTYPLVLAFHGGYGTGERLRRSTHFDAKADAKGFIAVFPDGIGNNWNDGRGTVNADIDDVGFVRQLIETLKSRLPIDATRIYAAGISNGGHFALRLACELSDQLAAVGTDIGPMPSNLVPACKPRRPVAVIGIQGADDPIAPIEGGEVASSPRFGLGKGGAVESAASTMNFWAAVNGCNPRPAVVRERPSVDDGTQVDKYSFAGCNGGAPVVYYIVQGMGHSWPPQVGPLPRITGATSYNINATDVMWDFFATISR